MSNRTEIIAETLKNQGVPGYEHLAAVLTEALQEEEICGLCGGPDPDKFAHPEHWPGEKVPDGPLVHADCERDECLRAHASLSNSQRREFLRRYTA